MNRALPQTSSTYRREADPLVIDAGRPIAHVAREIGVSEQPQGLWVTLARTRVNSRPPPALDADEWAELGRLRTEVADLRMDREFPRPPSRPRTSELLPADGGGEGLKILSLHRHH